MNVFMLLISYSLMFLCVHLLFYPNLSSPCFFSLLLPLPPLLIHLCFLIVKFKPPTPTTPTPSRKLTPPPPTVPTATTTTTATTQPPPTKTSAPTTTAVPTTTIKVMPPTTPNAESITPIGLPTTSPSVRTSTEHTEVTTIGFFDVGRTTKGTDEPTRGFSKDQLTDSLNITQRHTVTPLPSSTSHQTDSHSFEPSGGSSSEMSMSASSKVTLLSDPRDSKTQENDSPLWLNRSTNPESEVVSTSSSVIPTFVLTQSPETDIDLSFDSGENSQSDSTIDSYFLVSAKARKRTTVTSHQEEPLKSPKYTFRGIGLFVSC